jgi:FkbM family methyltransferase
MILKTKQKLALARSVQKPVLWVRRLLGLGPETQVRRGGINWALDLREGIDFAIYLTGKFEPSTVKAIAAIVEPGDTVIDIGANIGAHTLHLGKLVGPRGRVFALEPTRFAYNKLLANIALNPDISPQITANQVMLVGTSKSALEPVLYSSWPLDRDQQGHDKHGGKAMTTQGAISIKLDDYLKSRDVGTVKLVKLDVDGYEPEVLRGSSAFLKHQKPLIVMELQPYTLEERGNSLEQLLDILDGAGYRLSDETTGKALSNDPADLRSLVPDGGSINIVAKSV